MVAYAVAMVNRKISFGSTDFDAELGLLSKAGVTLAISQRAIALLRVLLESEGQPVSKDSLTAAAWPGQIVEEGNLTVQIAALRKVLGPMPDGNDWIVTVPRVGYRLARMPHATMPIPGSQVLPSLAVLPFETIGGEPEQDYFADGVVDDIITALGRFKNFAVVTRNSSFIYKGRTPDVREVANELGVRYVLAGHVRRAGAKLRITARLADARNSSELWSQNFDGALDDVFDFQDQITDSVAARVAPQIQQAELENSRRERPGSIQAYDLGLQALAKILAESEPENTAALVMLDQALALEPNNARLNSYAAWALEHRIVMGWPLFAANDRERCVAVARRGLEFAADDATVMTHCGMALLQAGREYDWGMAVLDMAVKANPNNLTVLVAAGVAHIHCGTIEDAMSYLRRAMSLSARDPFSHIALSAMGHACMVLGQFDEAVKWANQSLAQNQFFDPVLWILTAANAHLGNLVEARRHLDVLMRIAPGVTIAKIKAGQPAKDPTRIAAILEGLRMAGLPES